jgi:hypothetical protein
MNYFSLVSTPVKSRWTIPLSDEKNCAPAILGRLLIGRGRNRGEETEERRMERVRGNSQMGTVGEEETERRDGGEETEVKRRRRDIGGDT